MVDQHNADAVSRQVIEILACPRERELIITALKESEKTIDSLRTANQFDSAVLHEPVTL